MLMEAGQKSSSEQCHMRKRSKAQSVPTPTLTQLAPTKQDESPFKEADEHFEIHNQTVKDSQLH
jgi:hypothetical protein